MFKPPNGPTSSRAPISPAPSPTWSNLPSLQASAKVRAHLVHALALDLVGPAPGDAALAHEVLPSAPSLWYLTGFLAPFEAPHHERQGDDAEGELDAGDKRVGKGDDEAAPEAAAARRGFYPASMGLSLILPAAARRLDVEVTWGDYAPRDLAPDDARLRARRNEPWRRTPRRATLSIDLDPPPTSPSPVDDSGGLEIALSTRPIAAPGLPAGARTVAVFLVNRRPPVEGPADTAWCFQARLHVRADAPLVARPDLRRGDNADGTYSDWDEEVAALHYRDAYEYAVGHNTAVRPLPEPDGGPCFAVETTWIPSAEVEKVVPADVAGAELGVEALAAAAESPDAIAAALGGLALSYGAWIEGQAARFATIPGAAPTVTELCDRARVACRRIAAGVDLLRRDPDARLAFGLANKAIATALRQRATHGKEGLDPATVSAPRWRPFQLAFILLNLQGIAEPEHADRRVVDLLFFPTGGGKTEAYLGLAAFALVLRRLRHPGPAGAGVGVLMRYTLRLLTLDQLGRAATLICALEIERQRDPERLGPWPFEIGLWVGMAATPNAMGQKGESRPTTARARVLKHQRDPKRFPSPIPIDVCPWCGTKLSPKSFRLVPTEDHPQNLEIRCVNRDCRFTRNDSLPIVAVDEPLYRRLPAFLIATVDKFASLPWVGESGVLLGGADRFDNTGFYGPAEPRLGRRLPAPLPPPDLVIQDELHLISGPLGTMVGLFETAIEELCTREHQGRRIPPKIIAATATVRRAERQVQALYGRRDTNIFPPQGLDPFETWFSLVEHTKPGRIYLGVGAGGRAMKRILLQTYLALLGATRRAEQNGASVDEADGYFTLVGYFNSLRELGGMRRLVEDDIGTRAPKQEEGKPLGAIGPHRWVANRPIGFPQELTSREKTADIVKIKDRAATPHGGEERALDVLLASNMISVGVDISRLGVMVVAGQPKTTAEYIQASSRVGRSAKWPGLVVTAYNVYRPRDRSHYEHFVAYHESFYRHVEATSVTPFSAPAQDRGLAAVVVTLARLLDVDMTASREAMNAAGIQALSGRILAAIHRKATQQPAVGEAGEAAGDDFARSVQDRAEGLIHGWLGMIRERGDGQHLHYSPFDTVRGRGRPLLRTALEVQRPDPESRSMLTEDEKRFAAPTSMRDVEPSVHVWRRFKLGSNQ